MNYLLTSYAYAKMQIFRGDHRLIRLKTTKTMVLTHEKKLVKFAFRQNFRRHACNHITSMSWLNAEISIFERNKCSTFHDKGNVKKVIPSIY